MSEENILCVKYECMHPSCVVHCRRGEFDIVEDLFNELSDFYKDKEGSFKSPKEICRMGFPQEFRALKVHNIKDDALLSEVAAECTTEIYSDTGDDPGCIKHLKVEHRKILDILDRIDIEIQSRDVDALWVSSADLVNDILLHSNKKEELVLFPHLKGLLPMAKGVVSIIKEDHAEFFTILESFRDSLEEGYMMDGLARSVVTNLRNHIRKEDNEFFQLIIPYITPELDAKMLEDMKQAEAEYEPYVSPPLDVEKARQTEKAKQRRIYDQEKDKLRAAVAASADGSCCGV